MWTCIAIQDEYNSGIFIGIDMIYNQIHIK